MAFQDPNPTVQLVTADPLKRVIAVGNAGPTDAGNLTAWFEVEMLQGSTEFLLRIDKATSLSFVTNRSRTDTFTVPLGESFDGKRVRFVLQSEVDALQQWESPWVDMAGENFNNIPPPSLAAPGAPSGVTSEVSATVAQRAATEAATAAEKRRVVAIPNDSRYKLSGVFVDDDLPTQPTFGPMARLEDFYSLGQDFRLHRVESRDVGLLDRITVEMFGRGRENMWWMIAYANAIIDPEMELEAGDVLHVPSRSAMTRFLARSPKQAVSG